MSVCLKLKTPNTWKNILPITSFSSYDSATFKLGEPRGIHQVYFSLEIFWWTFFTCFFKLSGWMLWNVQILQMYWGCSTRWCSFMCLLKLLFLSDLLHSVQLIFAPFSCTFFMCLDKSSFDVAWWSHILQGNFSFKCTALRDRSHTT